MVEEHPMRNIFPALFMGAALLSVSPLAVQAEEHRVYDRDHKDYHDWNDTEDRAYRHWLTEERHEKYRDINHLKRADQKAYWQWRHEHADWR
jgi:hypothetical protein